MFHLRIVCAAELSADVIAYLEADDATTNLVVLHGAARQPLGDVVLCDVAREDTSLILDDLRLLGVTHEGSIALERVELADSDGARSAILAAHGEEADAVVWETVEARSSEESRLSWSYAAFMALAAVIAISGLMTDSEILIVGAMVVSPDFGPLAGLCVGLTLRLRALVLNAVLATVVGLVIVIVVASAVAEAVERLGLLPAAFDFDEGLSALISHPDAFTVIVALAAGGAGMLSLLTAKSGALVGVLISVTTIPASAQVALAISFGRWDSA
ncbi:MAG: DUF389 domain-containing protein, partial [Solirubrobacteraceae bacterium]|nr:DUF389 domain-containing protein [Solirubrobacteraceae bacterium]